jgi:hypothetical protein
MISDAKFPWSFERDEVDLLEEDIDEIYRTYQSPKGEVKTIEQAIILEQLETEERAEAEFSLMMGVKGFFKKSEEKTVWGYSSTEERVPEQSFSCETSRSPFYEHVFRFSEKVFVYAQDAYAHGGNKKEHAFRLRLNVKMIPIKCAVAMSEEMHDDPLSIAMAKKEYKLAIVYTERILISLAFLAADGDVRAKAFLAPGTHIKHVLQQHFLRLNNERRGFQQGYE